jgi:hypothetical protein
LPGQAAAFKFEAEPLDGSVVAEGEKFEAEGEIDAAECEAGDDAPEPDGHAAIGLAGVGGANIVRDDVVFD